MKLPSLYRLPLLAAALTLPAAADVIYSNLQNITIATDLTGVYVDVDGDTNWDINPFFGGVGVANSIDFQPVRIGTGDLDRILNLSAGTTIDGTSLYATNNSYGGSQDHLALTSGDSKFVAGQEGYLGFRLNGTDYGSMRVVFNGDNSATPMIKDWAYDTSGAAVQAGAIKQVGQDVIMSYGFTLASSLVNSGGTTNLVKSGAGTNTLSATSSYTGTTTVSAGTLVVNGNISTSSLTTVESGATLGGSGTVGDLTIDAGGFFSPGNSPGITTVIGDYTQNGQLNIEVDGLAAGNGAGYHDQVVVNGGVTLGGALNIVSFTGFTPVNGDLLFILLNDSTDSVSGTFSSLAQGAVVGNYLGFDWQISYTGDSTGNTFTGGNDVVLVAVNAIPEPNVAALLGGVGTILLLRRRRA